ncbi:ribosome biogenesis factor YjgA [Niveibacterium umoris]|uniref:Dual-action ribosomal maturation protein DarP n=1 Tax=Niveibacterium umoris TaxID=1193620 RepID=A0A840BMX0_9RHOO|nr:ribosome biogenesis factor YjgA [Niveibacterium umoris]MBB4014605.1 ribosome-associated protein [Niveibacterium umoris]
MPRTPQHQNDDDSEEYDGPSKSQRKRDMHALQAIGEELVALSPQRLAKVPLPERLHDAVLEYARVGKHEAKRRQLQYIGKLMRDVDPAPIREALDAFAGVSRAEIARQHKLERFRERLLEDEAVLGEIASAYPAVDLQHLRNLRRNALKEREAAKPPRSYREIFRILRDLEYANDADQPEPGDEDAEGDEA